jgi:hypothetical protein
MFRSNRTQPPPPTPQELELARIHSQRRERDRLLNALRSHSEAATAFGWIYAVLGSLGGIGLCFVTEDNGGFGTDEHPYIALGLGILLASLLIGSVVVMLAAWARAWAFTQR